MASPEADWLVQIADRPDVLQTRFRHAAAHLAYHAPRRAAGALVFSGPTLARHPAPAAAAGGSGGGPPEVTGSLMVFRLAGGEEAVREILEGDPLAKEGVWDLERAAVTPMMLFRPPQ